MDGEEARTYVEKLHPKDSRTQRAERDYEWSRFTHRIVLYKQKLHIGSNNIE